MEIQEVRIEGEVGEFGGRIEEDGALDLDVVDFLDEGAGAEDAALLGVVLDGGLVVVGGPGAEGGVGAVGGAEGDAGKRAGEDGVKVEGRARDDGAAEAVFGLGLRVAGAEHEGGGEAVVELEAGEIAVVGAVTGGAFADVAGDVAGERAVHEALAGDVARAAVEVADAVGLGFFVADAADVGEAILEEAAGELEPGGESFFENFVGFGGGEAVGLGVAVLEPVGVRDVEIVEAAHADARDGGEIVIGVARGRDVDGGDLRGLGAGAAGEVIRADEGPELGVVALDVAKLLVVIVAEARGDGVAGETGGAFQPEAEGGDAFVGLAGAGDGAADFHVVEILPVELGADGGGAGGDGVGFDRLRVGEIAVEVVYGDGNGIRRAGADAGEDERAAAEGAAAEEAVVGVAEEVFRGGEGAARAGAPIAMAPLGLEGVGERILGAVAPGFAEVVADIAGAEATIDGVFVVGAGRAEREVQDGIGDGGGLVAGVPVEADFVAGAFAVAAGAEGVGELEVARGAPVELRRSAVGDVLFRVVVQAFDGELGIERAGGGEGFAGGDAGFGGGGLVGVAEIHGGERPVDAGEDVVVVNGEGVAKSFRDGVGPGEFEIGAPAIHAGVADAGAFAEAEGLGVGGEEGVVGEAAFAGLEGGAADEIDGATEGVGAVFGRAEFADLDAGDVGGGGAEHLEIAIAAAGAEGRGGGGGDGHAVEGDLGVDGIEAAHADADDVVGEILHAHAGEPLHELAGIGVGDGAKLVGGDDALLAERGALLVHGDGGGVGLLGGLHDERAEFDGGVGGEREVALRGLAGGDGERDFLFSETREEDADGGRAGGHAGEAIRARLVGERDEVGALDRDAGVVEVVAVAGVLDAALDGAGGGGRGRLRGGERGGGEERAQEREDGFHGVGGGVGCQRGPSRPTMKIRVKVIPLSKRAAHQVAAT